MTEPVPQPTSPPIKAREVTFFFEKTNSFETRHADGFFGNLTPSGEIFLAFYVERSPIPKTMTCEFTDDGKTSDPRFSGKQGVYREVHSAVIMSRSVLDELTNHIEQLKNMMKTVDNVKRSP